MPVWYTYIAVAVLMVVLFLTTYWLYSISRKNAAKKALYGVVIVKAGLYDTFRREFAQKYSEFDEERNNSLAVAAVNEIFGDHSEKSLKDLDDNIVMIVEEIKNLGKNHPELRKVITDSIRIYIHTTIVLHGEPPREADDIIINATARGIYMEYADLPNLKDFLETVEKVRFIT